jgi:choline dehydrogenase-like flavoprotein
VDISAKVVVLAAGAFHTPAFLLKNKLCNGSGQVGKNLKLHLCARTIGIFDEIVNSHKGVCQNLYIDDYIEEGIMLEATFTGPASQLAGILGAGTNLWETCKKYRNMASLGIMISEKSAGRVRADNNGNPLITFRLGKQDVETLKKAMIISDRVLFAAGAKKVINGNFVFSEVKNVAELDEIAKKKTKAADWMLMAFHPQGTCRMGISAENSVVGPTGECHDLKNLYIADASVFPTSLGVNPQETIWVIATRVAEQIAKKI